MESARDRELLMDQEQLFLSSLGDAWYERNRKGFGQSIDPVQELMKQLQQRGRRFRTVLEVGCSNGWRLKALAEAFGCQVAGMDASAKAVMEGNAELFGGKKVLYNGLAVGLPWLDNAFDTIIYGYCLSLMEPSSYFRVAAEAHRCLQNGGVLIIHDRIGARRYKAKWADGVFMHIFDFPRLWLEHPSYTTEAEFLIHTGGDTDIVCALVRDDAKGFLPAVFSNGVPY